MELYERIYNELKHERSGLWYISDEYGSKIILKIPSNVARSFINGCPIEFLFGKDNKQSPPILHIGVRIYDDPVHFVSISQINRFKDEHRSLKRIMELKNVVMQVYTELNACVATVNVAIEQQEATRVLQLMGNIEDLYVGEFGQTATESLNCFDFTFDPSRKLPGVHEIEKEVISCTLSDFRIIESHFVGANEVGRISIANKNEGEIFEQQVWTALQSLFDFDIYRNPKVAEKNGYRELTDILAFSEYGIFLVETKAIAILNLEKERNMERKVASVQKQILKAIDQLKGAAKNIQEGVEIFSTEGKPIHFNKTLCPHCIVLVSELFPFGEWKNIVYQMFCAMVAQPMYLVVMDLKEFIRYIGFSRGDKNKLDYLLMDRVKQFTELQNIHLQIHEENFPG
jgi:hypothetical protein